jgi:parallel beta-helix repeat protein
MKNSLLKKGLIFGIIILFFGASIVPSINGMNEEINISSRHRIPLKVSDNRGNILYVGGNGTNNYTRIQDAINDSSDGNTVFVYDDSSPYNENIIVDKSINLIGENCDSTVIDGVETICVVSISADWVNFSGFTIQRSGSSNTGIKINSKNNKVTDNVILKCTYGIVIGNSYNLITENTLIKNINGIFLSEYTENNSITQNTIVSNDGSGIRLHYSCNNVFSDNNIVSNGGMGIDMSYFCMNNIITGNIISKNRDAITVWYSSNHNIISNNILSRNNEWGVYLGDSCNILISSNIINWNVVGGILFSNVSNNIISGNIISSNKYGLYLTQAYFNNTINRNSISNNRYGICLSSSYNNTISKNNLIDNKLNAFSDNSKNKWMRNYWNRPRMLPKLILGKKTIETRFGISFPIPDFEFDFRPGRVPYEIGM